MESDLKEFLQERGIDDNVIKKLEDEKLDSSIISTMDDDTLQKFIPKYGDRHTIRAFCMRIQTPNQNLNRESLIDKLKRKLTDKRKRKSEDEATCNNTNQKNIGKPTRIIELGWLCDGVQVRTKFGGGTRRISILKTSTKKDILEKCIQLFFPNGISTKGSLQEFHVDVLDFKRNNFDDELNVQEIFNVTELTTLRFYLNTQSKKGNEKPDVKDNLSKPQEIISLDENALEVNKITDHIEKENTRSSVTRQTTEPTNFYMDEYLICFDDQVANASYRIDFEPGIASTVCETVDLPVSPTTSQSSFIKLHLHRGHIFQELILEFEKLNVDNLLIETELILPNGEKEAAFDGGGVFRDALSEFWTSFYNICCSGTSFKVPIIRHDYDKTKWQTIAKILYQGYKQAQYFPTKLARPFVEHTIFGKTNYNLTQSFLNFIGNYDSQILRNALNNFCDVNMEELLDVLDSLECKQIVNESNINKIIEDIAHKEFIQKPMFIIDVWHSLLRNKFSEANINEIYVERMVSNKNILKLINSPKENKTPDEEKAITFLKKFIREADTDILEKFLRFCTGADVITGENIHIEYITTTGIERSPVAHTCSCILELPTTYDNYNDFKFEFQTLLTSSVWVMDII